MKSSVLVFAVACLAAAPLRAQPKTAGEVSPEAFWTWFLGSAKDRPGDFRPADLSCRDLHRMVDATPRVMEVDHGHVQIYWNTLKDMAACAAVCKFPGNEDKILPGAALRTVPPKAVGEWINDRMTDSQHMSGAWHAHETALFACKPEAVQIMTDAMAEFWKQGFLAAMKHPGFKKYLRLQLKADAELVDLVTPRFLGAQALGKLHAAGRKARGF